MIKTAPGNVQSAFKNLLSYVQQIKTDIQNASSLGGPRATSFGSPRQDTPARSPTGPPSPTLGLQEAGWSRRRPPRPSASRRRRRSRPFRGRCRRGRPSCTFPRPDESHPTLGECDGPGLACSTCEDSAPLQGRGTEPRRSCAGNRRPTANSLGVIVVHLGYAERLWIRAIFAGEPMDMGWRNPHVRAPEGLGRRTRSSRSTAPRTLLVARRARRALPPSTSPSCGDVRPTTLRWAVYHLIEETTPHARPHGPHARALRRKRRPLEGAPDRARSRSQPGIGFAVGAITLKIHALHTRWGSGAA